MGSLYPSPGVRRNSGASAIRSGAAEDWIFRATIGQSAILTDLVERVLVGLAGAA